MSRRPKRCPACGYAHIRQLKTGEWWCWKCGETWPPRRTKSEQERTNERTEYTQETDRASDAVD